MNASRQGGTISAGACRPHSSVQSASELRVSIKPPCAEPLKPFHTARWRRGRGGAAGRADKELKALHITSIRELGTWKFALWSEALVSLAEFETADFSS